MLQGTSPAITPSGSGYETAFEANTTHLWTFGSADETDRDLGMASGTSPAIAQLATGGYETAFQANTTRLWTFGTVSQGDTGLGMAPGTSPSIAALQAGGYEVAAQMNDGNLWLYGSAGTLDTGLAMAPGTSPSIAGLTGGGYEVAFEAKPVPASPIVSTPIPPPAPTATGKRALSVKVLIRWRWNHGHSRIVKFLVGRHPHDMTLRMRCLGRGCPTPRTRAARPGKLKSFVRAVLGTRYAVGDRLVLTLSAARYRTERAEITIRNSRKPAVRLL
jgi:hypothetical protein